MPRFLTQDVSPGVDCRFSACNLVFSYWKVYSLGWSDSWDMSRIIRTGTVKFHPISFAAFNWIWAESIALVIIMLLQSACPSCFYTPLSREKCSRSGQPSGFFPMKLQVVCILRETLCVWIHKGISVIGQPPQECSWLNVPKEFAVVFWGLVVFHGFSVLLVLLSLPVQWPFFFFFFWKNVPDCWFGHSWHFCSRSKLASFTLLTPLLWTAYWK